MSNALRPEQKEQIQEMINKGYADINADSTHVNKYNIYFSIIQQKLLIGNTHHIYLDAKFFIQHYILSSHEQDYEYDILSIEKLNNAIKSFSIYQKENLYKYMIFFLKENGQEEIVPTIEKQLHDLRIEIALENAKQSFNIVYPFKLILLVSTKSFKNTLLTLIFMILVLMIVLYPNPNKDWQTFKYTYTTFTHIFLIDHFINIALLLLGSDDRTKVYALNYKGAAALLTGKILYLLYIANVILKQIEKRLEF